VRRSYIQLYPGTVELAADLEGIASRVAPLDESAVVAAVLAVEIPSGGRRYLCAFESDDGARRWAVVDEGGTPLRIRRDVRDVVTAAALCELAEENAFPGDLDELRAQLVGLRLTENPAGIDEAEEAALALQHVLGSPPQLASPARLDAIGVASRRLELSLDPTAGSPFGVAMQASQAVADELWADVEATYLVALQEVPFEA
jgi:hypothetical protein